MKRKIPNVYKPTIDQGIYGAVKFLNNCGFQTTYSCSGHGVEKAYIAFKGILTKESKQVVGNILRTRYGARGCKWFDRQSRPLGNYRTLPASSVHFWPKKKGQLTKKQIEQIRRREGM